MSETATDTETEEEAVITDDAREAAVAWLTEQLHEGRDDSAVIDSHIQPGRDLYIRIDRAAWVEAHRKLQAGGYRLFDFLSVIDWLPSPFGRDMESEQDWAVHGREIKELPPMESGVAGGDTRFQMISRVYDIETNIGINLKADMPDDDVSIETIMTVFPGANWHEREAWEMFGVHITGHPDLRMLYLPTGFEGNPMRKDYPLLARRVKPWPGIVDVEQMPGDDDEAAGDSGGDTGEAS